VQAGWMSACTYLTTSSNSRTRRPMW